MREAVYLVSGCEAERVLEAVERLFGARRVYIEGLGEWVDVDVEGWGGWGRCRGVRLRFRGLRVWSDVFEVCVGGEGEMVAIRVTRRGGVGRVSAGLVGSWFMEELYRVCPGLVQVA